MPMGKLKVLSRQRKPGEKAQAKDGSNKVVLAGFRARRAFPSALMELLARF